MILSTYILLFNFIYILNVDFKKLNQKINLQKQLILSNKKRSNGYKALFAEPDFLSFYE